MPDRDPSPKPPAPDATPAERLTALRQDFTALSRERNKQKRGKLLETFLTRLSEAFNVPAIEPFERKGEQIDGAIRLDQRTFLIEAKWQSKKSDPAELNHLRVKLLRRPNVGGVFISMAGFTSGGVAGETDALPPALFLVDGDDLRAVIEGKIRWDVLLRAKQLSLDLYVKVLTPVGDILESETLLQTAQKPLVEPAAQPSAPPSRIAPTRLRHGADKLFGRTKELRALNAAWRAALQNKPSRPHVLTFVAWGGVGKTALIVAWTARLAQRDYGGARYFDWSFYSQGAREQGNASSDAFIAAALKFFGDEPMANSPAAPWDKGARLAELIARERTLLILDGLEPLQYPPGPLAGQLKDPAVEVLLRALAQHNPGLCAVTTRESVVDLAPFRETTAPQWNLEQLSDAAGAALLHQAGVRRAGAAEISADDPELLAASHEFAGHALTLRMIGIYLSKAHAGDIRHLDRVEFEKADPHFKLNPQDADKPYGHAFKAIAVYERWLAQSAEDGARQLAILRLLGLFDRPADEGCLAALRKKPVIAGLTEPLVELPEEDWNLGVAALEDCRLISRVQSGALASQISNLKSSLDAHPLIREYFAHQLRAESPDAWRSAHKRLYEHLTTTTEYRPGTLAGLQPLYQSIVHGCLGGLLDDALNMVHIDRILRGTGFDGFFSPKQLGAIGADLGAIACFFSQCWTRPSPNLPEHLQAWLLAAAGFDLCALGRLDEATEPLQGAFAMRVQQGDWANAATTAGNLSEQELKLGLIGPALRHAQQAVTYADRSERPEHVVTKRARLGDAQHQAGECHEALAVFREAESMQAQLQTNYPLLYSIQGFQYCDLLLAQAERAAWRRFSCAKSDVFERDAISACRAVERRASKTLAWALQACGAAPLDVGITHLTLGCAGLYTALLSPPDIQDQRVHTDLPRSELDEAIGALRRAGQRMYIPLALLSRAWLRVLDHDSAGAQADLDEAWHIASRGPMRLHLADIHLYRARLFLRADPYPWNKHPDGRPRGPQDDLAAARKLIEECGYNRRLEELEDAERAAAALA